jgi:hypothetical protein
VSEIEPLQPPDVPAPRVAAVLLAGRAGFRLTQWASGLALLAVWGRHVFAGYATALQVSSWLIVLFSAGAEKTLLALGARQGGERVVGLLARLAAVPHLVCTAALLLSLALTGPGQGTMLAAAADYSSGFGLVLVLVAVMRLRGRAAWDPVGVGLVAAGHLALVPLVAAAGVQPWLALTVLAAASSVAAAVVYPRAVRAAGAAAGAPRRAVLESVALMGAFELSNLAGVAVAYAILGSTSRRGEAAPLYLAMLVAQVFVGLAVYLTRLWAPRASRRAEAGGAGEQLEAGGRVLRRNAAVGAPVAALAVAAALAARKPGGTHEAALLAVVAVAIVVTAALVYGCYLVENADPRGRRASASGAVAGFVVVCACSALLVPVAGAVGCAAALAVGVSAQSAVVASRLRRATYRPTTT